MSYPMLTVKWSESEEASYYVNQITAGWDKRNQRYWLKSFSGTYYFDCGTKAVTLDTGTEMRNKPGAIWGIVN